MVKNVGKLSAVGPRCSVR